VDAIIGGSHRLAVPQHYRGETAAMKLHRIGAIIAVGALGAVLVGPAAVSATQPDPEHKVGICHRTDSDSNPYVYIEVDDAAAETGDKLSDHLGNNDTGHKPTHWKSDGTFRGVAHSDGDAKDDYLAPDGASDCEDFVVTTTTTDDTTTTTSDQETTTSEETTTTTGTPGLFAFPTASFECGGSITVTNFASANVDDVLITGPGDDVVIDADGTTPLVPGDYVGVGRVAGVPVTDEVPFTIEACPTTTTSSSADETTPGGNVEELTPPSTDTIGAATSPSSVSTSLLLVLAGVLATALVVIPAAARKRR
jgi:hypothetical protein